MVWSGFVTPAQLASKREYVIVGVFVVAAVLTPPDVVSQILMAVPTYLLYELGIIAARWLVPQSRQVEAQAKLEQLNRE
jgi:sec-independent protein translocase protein TatC